MICKYPNITCMYKASKISKNGKTGDACGFDDDRCVFDDSELYNEYLKITSVEKHAVIQKNIATLEKKMVHVVINFLIVKMMIT